MADLKMPVAFVIALVVVAVIVAGGLLIGHYVIGGKPRKVFVTPDEFEQEVTKTIMKTVDPKSIADYIKVLSTFNSDNTNVEETEWLEHHFEDCGFEKVSVFSYDVLLQKHDQNSSNYIYLLDKEGNVQHQSKMDLNYVPYSKSKTEQGEVVYAHFGREEDILELEKRGIDLQDKILLIRCKPSNSFIIDIVKRIQNKGGKAVLFYPDPIDFDTSGNSVDPLLFSCAGYINYKLGDPLTPIYPSTTNAFRISLNKTGLPAIPIQSIRADDATLIFTAMSDTTISPKEWHGSLNSNYPLGPGFKEKGMLKLEVNSQNVITTVRNVIAIMEGSDEPDRYIILGTPRNEISKDHTGTAILMEVARIFGSVVQDKELLWKPKRSIVLCSWGGSEQGAMGSIEWIQEEKILLEEKSVAYFHIQSPVQGKETLKVSSVPLLYQTVYQAASKVGNPNEFENELERTSIYKTWLFNYPSPKYDGMPRVHGIENINNDVVGFIHELGIPVVDFYYGNINDAPSVSTNVTEDYLYHAVICRMWTELAHYLLNAPVLPMASNDYSKYLFDGYYDFEKKYKNQTETHKISLSCLKNAIDDFSHAAKHFQEGVASRVDIEVQMSTRIVNDRLIQLERAFINNHGKTYYKHVIFAPSFRDNDTVFPALSDAMNDKSIEGIEYVDGIKKQISELIYYISNGAKVLWGTLKYHQQKSC